MNDLLVWLCTGDNLMLVIVTPAALHIGARILLDIMREMGLVQK